MVNIVTNGQPTSVTYNVDSGEVSPQIHVQDSLVNLATEIGMVDAMQDINEDSYQTDKDLREDYNMEDESIYQQQEDDAYEEEPSEEEPEHLDREEYQQPEKPKKKTHSRKTKGDKRFDDLIYKLGAKAQEAEEYARQRDINAEKARQYEDTARELKQAREDHAAYILSIEKQRIDADIERVTDIMIRAKETGQDRPYIDGMRLMNDLDKKRYETEERLTQLNQMREEEAYEPEVTEQEKLAEETFYALSDVKEVSSPAYTNWLKKNDFYNSYSPNFDADLAKDVHDIKRNFNKFLRYSGNTDFIGTDEYYDEFDALSKQKLFGDLTPQQPRYSNRGYQNQHEENDMQPINYSIDPDYDQSLGQATPEGQSRRHGIYPDDTGYQAPREARRAPSPTQQNRGQQRTDVAPVNRSGYNQQYKGQLPALTEQERKLAIMMPMFDTDGRSLSERERLQQYASGKADMMNKNRR